MFENNTRKDGNKKKGIINLSGIKHTNRRNFENLRENGYLKAYISLNTNQITKYYFGHSLTMIK